jgi:hypothetical protein
VSSTSEQLKQTVKVKKLENMKMYQTVQQPIDFYDYSQLNYGNSLSPTGVDYDKVAPKYWSEDAANSIVVQPSTVSVAPIAHPPEELNVKSGTCILYNPSQAPPRLCLIPTSLISHMIWLHHPSNQQ